MRELALNLGGAAYKYVDAFDVPTPMICADSTSTMMTGYSLLLAMLAVIAGMAVATA